MLTVDKGLDVEPEPTGTRGGFFARLTGAGAAVFVAMASRKTQPASAGDFACCDLIYPPSSGNTCPLHSYGDFYCNQGSKKVWYCCQQNQLFGCGECTTGSDCFHGDWKCSYGWNTGFTC